jgi:polyhydroxyalkanoate synthase
MAQPKISVDLILSKLAEEAEKVGESAQKASDVLLEPLETEIAITPYDVI